MKKIVSILLAALLLASVLPLGASAADSGYCGAPGNEDGVRWEVAGTEEDLCLTISGTGDMESYIGDMGIRTTPWAYQNITRAVIEEGVSNIGGGAFAYKQLTSATIPNSVTSIGESAFQNCPNLTDITLPDSLTSIGRWAFGHCLGLTAVTIPYGVTSVEDYAFQGSALQSVTMYNNVASIGERSFACSKLTDVYFYGTEADWQGIVVKAGNDALLNATIHYMDPPSVPDPTPTPMPEEDFVIEDGVLISYTGPGGDVVIPDGVTSIGDHAFKQCTNLTSIIFPNTLTSIGDFAFSECHRLDNVVVPGSVKTVGNYAFHHCFNLHNVTFCEGVESIGDDAFFYSFCDPFDTLGDERGDGPNTIALPKSLWKVGYEAFWGCPSFKGGIYYGGTKEEFQSINFDGANGSIAGESENEAVMHYNWPIIDPTDTDQVTEDGIVFNRDKTAIRRYPTDKQGAYTTPAGVATIASGAFNESTVTSLTLGEDVSTLEAYAFYKCNLESVVFPSSMAAISESAFSTSGLRELTVPGTVEAIGANAFEFCNNLETVTLRNSVASIGENAFWKCENLKSVTIPKTVTSVGANAFWECASLTDVYYPGTEKEWMAIDFGSGGNGNLLNATIHFNSIIIDPDDPDHTWEDGVMFNKDKTVLVKFPADKAGPYTVPDGVTAIGDSAFIECTGVTAVTLPDSVASIGSNAFAKCASLESISLPEGLAAIGEGAFTESGLKTVAIPSSVQSIGKRAFSFCHNLTELTVKKGVASIGEEAFWNSEKLAKVTLPSSIVSIGTGAFWGCEGIQDVYYDGTQKQWMQIDFGTGANGSLLNATIHYQADTTPGPGFTDVPADAWFKKAVDWAVENKITSGTGDGSTFSPNAFCTRGQIVTFLWNAAGKPVVEAGKSFTDVPDGVWYANAVNWAVANHITNGTGDGTTFSPDALCTRSQAVTFLWNAAQKPVVSGGNSFTDVPANIWYGSAVNWAVANKITSGTGDGTTFSPDKTCTRAEIVMFMYKN